MQGLNRLGSARYRDRKIRSVGEMIKVLLERSEPDRVLWYRGQADKGYGLTKVEPFWLELGATIEVFPVMSADDLRAGLQCL